MAKRHKPGVDRDGAEQRTRDAEVLRATAELASYFKGQRTEREARAALKIIKAFVRERERGDAKSRRPLPGLAAAAPEPAARHGSRDAGARHARKTRRAKREKPAMTPAIVPNDPPLDADHAAAVTEE
jgi:hypothetical protein